MTRDSSQYQRNMTQLEAVTHTRTHLLKLHNAVKNSAVDRQLFIESSRRAGAEEPTARIAHRTGASYVHSRYRPAAEAQRSVDRYRDCDYVVVLGLGLGYEAEALLSLNADLMLRVIEPDAGLIRQAMEARDLSILLTEHRCEIIVEPSPLAAVERLDYFVFQHQKFATVPLQARVDADPTYFQRFHTALQKRIDGAGADYRASMLHGKNWTKNTILNLLLIPHAAPLATLPMSSMSSHGPVDLVAAGPGAAPRIRCTNPQSNAIVCDTAVGPIVARGGIDLTTVTVDPQAISTLHYLGVPSQTVHLVADIGTHHSLLRRFSRLSFLSSSHPLHRLLSKLGVPIGPHLVRSGSVADTVLRLAAYFQITTVRLHGFDFAYQAEQAYLRHSMVDRILERGSNRLLNYGTQNYQFVQARSAKRAPDSGDTGYRSSLLEDYRSTLEHTLEELGYRAVPGNTSSATREFSLLSGGRSVDKIEVEETSPYSLYSSVGAQIELLVSVLEHIKSLNQGAADLMQTVLIPAAIHYHERYEMERGKAFDASRELLDNTIRDVLNILQTRTTLNDDDN